MGVLGAMVHYDFIIQGDGRYGGGGGELSCDAWAHQCRPVRSLWAVDVRNELEFAARDSHARPRSPVGIRKYRLHNQFVAIAMPFPI